LAGSCRCCDSQARRQQRLSSLPCPRVSLVWARINKQDHVRSIAPDRLAPLAAVAGVSSVSLQKRDARDAGTSAMLSSPGITLHDFTAELRDLADTAALVTALDLVIAIGMDTITVRLAALRLAPVQATSWGHPENVRSADDRRLSEQRADGAPGSRGALH
jgi:hypothetical protein